MRTFYSIKLKTIRNAIDCDNLPSQYTKITTDSICRICTTCEGTDFEGWIDVK